MTLLKHRMHSIMTTAEGMD